MADKQPRRIALIEATIWVIVAVFIGIVGGVLVSETSYETTEAAEFTNSNLIMEALREIQTDIIWIKGKLAELDKRTR